MALDGHATSSIKMGCELAPIMLVGAVRKLAAETPVTPIARQATAALVAVKPSSQTVPHGPAVVSRTSSLPYDPLDAATALPSAATSRVSKGQYNKTASDGLVHVPPVL